MTPLDDEPTPPHGTPTTGAPLYGDTMTGWREPGDEPFHDGVALGDLPPYPQDEVLHAPPIPEQPAHWGRTAGTKTPAPRNEHRPARAPRSGTARDAVRSIKARSRIEVAGGTALTMLVLACHREDTTGVDLASGTLVRARVPWPEGRGPDLAPFDVVEAVLASEPERDDLAQPEAVTVDGLPRHLGTLRGRKVKRMLRQLVTPHEEHVLGFPGASAPYWEFRGFRPSIALVVPTKGPVLFRRAGDRAAWVRFGWGRSDNWLPVEDPRAERALDVARRDRLSGKPLLSVLGFKPHYLVVAVSTPRDGHCYKAVRAILPRS